MMICSWGQRQRYIQCISHFHHHKHCNALRFFHKFWMPSTHFKPNGHFLHDKPPKHPPSVLGFSDHKSIPNGQIQSPNLQCPEGNEDNEYAAFDAETIFKIISTHSPSEPSMVPSLMQSGVAFTNDVVERVLKRSRYSHGNGLRALQFFFWVGRQRGYSHTSEAYNQMLFILARMRKFDRVWELLWEMHRNDVNLITHKTIQIVLARVAKVCSLTETIEAFEKFKNYIGVLDIEAFNALLRALCQERNMEDARTVYHQLKSRFKPNTQTFNILLSGWKTIEEARSFYDEMIQLGCRPDIVTYNTLLDALCKGMDMREAFKIVDEMRENECYPDVKTYTVLIGGLGLIGQHDRACKLLKEMTEYGCYPDAAVYNAIIKNFCMARKLSEGYRFLDEMVKAGIDPNPNTYNNFIRYYYRSSNCEEAWNVHQRMIRSGCLPHTQMCMLLMKLFCQRDQLDLALQLWDDMVQKGYGSYSLVLDILMDALCDNGKLDEAEKCFLETIEKGQKPSSFSYKRLRVLLELAKKHDIIQALSEKMRSIEYL